ncbi:MAG TPA: DinB family protein [Bryobacteraceae bacterium]|nr:DinB family protein [Bryobacteraceae bacterium]
MFTKDAIRYSLDLADQSIQRSLASVEDTPTTFPTPNGGCHPLWVVGHLAYVEGMAHQLLGIGANPVADWAKFFEQGTTPIADATQYPPLEDVRARYTKLRKRTLQLLESLSEADLDTPTKFQPAGLEEHFATYGRTLLTLALHQMSHRSHITDAVRAAGRPSELTARLQATGQ